MTRHLSALALLFAISLPGIAQPSPRKARKRKGGVR